MISPQTVEHSRGFAEEKGLTLTLLSDPGNKVAEAYGLAFALPEDLRKVYKQFGIDLEKHNGDDSWRLPLSARYIIGKDGVIQYAEVSADYTQRPDPSHTIEALKNISA